MCKTFYLLQFITNVTRLYNFIVGIGALVTSQWRRDKVGRIALVGSSSGGSPKLLAHTLLILSIITVIKSLLQLIIITVGLIITINIFVVIIIIMSIY